MSVMSFDDFYIDVIVHNAGCNVENAAYPEGTCAEAGAIAAMVQECGGRIGTANEIGRPSFEVGPFSALYIGADVGVTWSFGAQDEAREASLARR